MEILKHLCDIVLIKKKCLFQCHGLDPPPMTFERRWKGRHNSEGQQHSEGRHHSEGQKDNPFAISSNNAQWKTWTPNSAWSPSVMIFQV